MLIQEAPASHPGASGFCRLSGTSPKFPRAAKVAFFPQWHPLSPPCPSPARLPSRRAEEASCSPETLSSYQQIKINTIPPQKKENKRKSNKSHMCLQAPAKTVIKSLLFLEKQGACQRRGEEAVNPQRGGFLPAIAAASEGLSRALGVLTGGHSWRMESVGISESPSQPLMGGQAKCEVGSRKARMFLLHTDAPGVRHHRILHGRGAAASPAGLGFLQEQQDEGGWKFPMLKT